MTKKSFSDDNGNTTRTICIGPIIIALAAYLFHSSIIAKQISDADRLRYIAKLLYWRLPDLFIGLLIATALSQIKNRVVRLFGNLLLCGYCLLLIVDSAVMATLNDRISMYDLFRFTHEWSSTASFLRWQHLLILLLLTLSPLWRARINKQTIPLLCVASTATLLLSQFAPIDIDVTVRQYRGTTISHLGIFNIWGNQKGNFKYSDTTVQYYLEQKSRPHLGAMPAGSVVFLIVESLSASLSQKTSGIDDFVPEFDKLANKGVLFTNVVANHPATEGAMVSIFQGIPPIHFPTGTPQVYSEFNYLPSAVQQLTSAGFNTVFLTTGDLSFLDRKPYFRSIGFKEVYGVNDLPSCKNAPRQAFDSAPDDYLYREAMTQIAGLMQKPEPFFLALLTVSTHLFPNYVHPYKGPASEESVWNWATSEMAKFYSDLERTDFFERNGVLIIVGDHRKMLPVSQRERERYGDSAIARVPVLLIGKQFSAGRIDSRFLQLADILPLYDSLSTSDPLSAFAVFVNRYTANFDFVTNASKLDIFLPNGQSLTAELDGDQLTLSNSQFPEREEVTNYIHRQRALHQNAKAKFIGGLRQPD